MSGFPWKYLVVEGNIGAGKTTLASMLAEAHGTRLMLEQFSDNPFLPGFYKNPVQFAFPLELSFLAERYQHLKRDVIQQDLFNPRVVSDYFILKSLIFARINLPEPEFQLFEKLFQIIKDNMPMPDKIVYLHSECHRLQQNIRIRGREYEQEIAGEYLDKIQKGYFELLKELSGLPILVIDVTAKNFVKEPKSFARLNELIHNSNELGMHYYTL
jgi:deoxyguanosine kinase